MLPGAPRQALAPVHPDRVFLTDQFRDNVEVAVLTLNTHCSEASQHLSHDGSVAGDFDRGLDCYTIRDAPAQPRFQPQNIDVSDAKFGNQTLTVSKAASLCVPGLKISGLRVEGGGFVCYQARTAKGQPRFQQRNIVVEDQFTEKDVRVIRPVAYCAPTEKKLDAPNDDIEDATDIVKDFLKGGDPLDLHVSTVHATPADSDPFILCKTDYTNSVWYHWRYNGNKSLMLDTSGSSYDTVLAVFHDNDPTTGIDLKEIACNDDADSSSSDSFAQFDARANEDYYILVGSSDGHGGKLKLRITAKADGPDTCSVNPNVAALNQLTYVGESFIVHKSTMNAGPAGITCPQSDAPACGTKTPEHTIWFNYTTPSDQVQKVSFNASASSYDTLVAVYKDSTLIVCGNDSVNASPLLANTTYHVMVGDVDADQEGGKLKLRFKLEGFIPAGSQAGAVGQGPPSNSLICYQVRQARHRTAVENITDQFSERQLQGAWTLSIGGVNSICLPTYKSTCTRFEEPAGAEGEAARICIST